MKWTRPRPVQPGRACARWLALLAVPLALLAVPGAQLAAPRAALGKPAPPDLPALPLSVAVAVEHGQPVVTDPWLEHQVAEAERLLSPHGVHVRLVRQRASTKMLAALENAEDRDTLASYRQPQVINVFVVRQLRDVDDPRRLRMGVRWRLRRNLRKDYIIMSATAMPTTLAHELGHYFGNGHSWEDNNIMSYRRSDLSAVRFNAEQGAKMRRMARWYLRSKRLQPASAFDRNPPPTAHQ